MDETSGSVQCAGLLASLGSSTRVATVETSMNIARHIRVRPTIRVSIPTFATSIAIEPSLGSLGSIGSSDVLGHRATLHKTTERATVQPSAPGKRKRDGGVESSPLPIGVYPERSSKPVAIERIAEVRSDPGRQLISCGKKQIVKYL